VTGDKTDLLVPCYESVLGKVWMSLELVEGGFDPALGEQVLELDLREVYSHPVAAFILKIEGRSEES